MFLWSCKSWFLLCPLAEVAQVLADLPHALFPIPWESRWLCLFLSHWESFSGQDRIVRDNGLGSLGEEGLWNGCWSILFLLLTSDPILRYNIVYLLSCPRGANDMRKSTCGGNAQNPRRYTNYQPSVLSAEWIKDNYGFLSSCLRGFYYYY